MDKEDGSFICVEADLLCDEEATSLSFNDGDALYEKAHKRNGTAGTSWCNGGEKCEQVIDMPFITDDCFGWMIEREKDYLPRNDYLERLRSGELDASSRTEALDWMLKACVHHKFGEVCLYSSVNYFDRFVSEFDLPVGKTWATQLVAVSCLLLAAKMHEVDVPNTLDLQCGLLEQPGEPRFFLFESRTVKRMEMLLLNVLKWNINPCSPLSFVEYFLQKKNYNQLQTQQLTARSLQIVARATKGIDFLEFRPSEIAAAVTSYISGEMPATCTSTQSCSIGTDKERVTRCVKLIQHCCSANAVSSLSSVTNSPNGVLEATFWSDDGAMVGSRRSFSDNGPDAKRRKLGQPRTSPG